MDCPPQTGPARHFCTYSTQSCTLRPCILSSPLGMLAALREDNSLLRGHTVAQRRAETDSNP